MNIKNTNSVYINSLEGADLYEHMIRDKEIKNDYVGMIPFSLELMQLRKLGLTERKSGETKFISDDIINVKFNKSVSSGDKLIEVLTNKINELDGADIDNVADGFSVDNNDSAYKEKLIEFVELIKNEKDEAKWNGLNLQELRNYIYQNGFYISGVKYVNYKRSSSKSRTGQVLFIKEELAEPMLGWSRMRLDFKEDDEVDLASLLAYESLVGSSIISTVNIKPHNILIIDDIKSKFKEIVNVVETDENGELVSVTKEIEIENDIFDGQSLLDSRYFPKGKSMMLLRQHMFKSASFNTNIQQFLMDNKPDEIDFDKWRVTNMFGEKMLAKDVHLIITPNSLKALKFSYLTKDEKGMFKRWKNAVLRDKSIFGVCQYEEQSSRGEDEEGNTMQRLSYQMINSLPFSQDEITELSKFEKDYIMKLKNDDKVFADYLIKNANLMNNNEMFYELYQRNNKIVNTANFRRMRASEINIYVDNVKKGRIRVKGDYNVMLGNAYEMLLHSINKFDVNKDKSSLVDKQIYSKMFADKTELAGFRNPHTSASNTAVLINTQVDEIDRYFNLSDNIVVINSIKHNILNKLSGADFDSDTVLLVDDEIILNKAKSVQDKFKVCVNNIESEKVIYQNNNADKAKIDNKLQESGGLIGEVVNLGQLVNSKFYDEYTKDAEFNMEMQKSVDIMTVLSGVAIDLAKKMYDVDFKKIINKTRKQHDLKDRPLFFRFVSQNRNIKVKKFNTAMDYLQVEIDKIGQTSERKNVDLDTLLIKQDSQRANRRQLKRLNEINEELINEFNTIFANFSGDEAVAKLEFKIRKIEAEIKKMKLNNITMYAFLQNVAKQKVRESTRMLSILHSAHQQTFVEAFKESSEDDEMSEEAS